MNEITRDITAILSSIVGLAIITVLVKNSSGTSDVIGAGAKGFAQDLSTAMGNAFQG